MKTIITASDNHLKSNFDRRFGRAAWFCLYDEETGETAFYQNDSLHDGSGAGLKAAEKVLELNATKVISGDFGPKAKDLLTKFYIQLVIIQAADTTVEDIIKKIKHHKSEQTI